MKKSPSFDSSAKVCAVDNAQLLNAMTSDATMCCSKCGAKAHNPANLCSPVPFPGTDLP